MRQVSRVESAGPASIEAAWSVGVECVDELDLDAGGSWLVSTASGSLHVLDLDALTVTRLPGDEAVVESPAGRARVPARLRRDAETLPLLDLVGGPIRVGRSAILVVGGVDSYPGYAHTTRVTTPVIAIRRLTRTAV